MGEAISLCWIKYLKDYKNRGDLAGKDGILIQLKKPILKTDFNKNGENLLMDGPQKIIFINHDIQRKILPLFESLLKDEQLVEKVKPYQAQIDELKNTDFSY